MKRTQRFNHVAVGLAFALLCAAPAQAQLEWRVSVKFILDDNGLLPATGNLNTHAEAWAQFALANELLDGYGRGYRIHMTLEDDLANLPPPYFCVDGELNGEPCDPDQGDGDCEHSSGDGTCEPLGWHCHGGVTIGKECTPPDSEGVCLDIGVCTAGVCDGGTLDGGPCDPANGNEDCHNQAGDGTCDPLTHWYDAPFTIRVRKHLDRAAEAHEPNDNPFRFRPDTINIYVLHSRRGGQSVQPPYGTGLLLGQSGGVTTPLHEVGHFLGLPHTFGGVTCDGPADPDFDIVYPCGPSLPFIQPDEDHIADTLPTTSCWCLEDLTMYNYCQSFGPDGPFFDPRPCPQYAEPVLPLEDREEVLDTFHNVMGYQANSALRERLTSDQLDKLADVSNTWRHLTAYPPPYEHVVDIVDGCTHVVDGAATGSLWGINTCGNVPLCAGGEADGNPCDAHGDCPGGACVFLDGSSQRPYPTIPQGLAAVEDSVSPGSS